MTGDNSGAGRGTDIKHSKITEFTTSDGIKVIHQFDSSTPMIYMQCCFSSIGDAYWDKNAVTSVFKKCFANITVGKNAEELEKFLLRWNIELNCAIDRSNAVIGLSFLKNDFDNVAPTLNNIITKPSFDHKRLKLIKSQFKAYHFEELKDPLYVVRKKFYEISIDSKNFLKARFFDDKAVEAVKMDDLHRYASCMTKKNLCVAIKGNLSCAQAKDFIAKLFNKLPAASPIQNKLKKINIKPPLKKIHYVKIADNSNQSVVCFYITKFNNEPIIGNVKTYLKMKLLSGVLSLLLYEQIRSQQGLVYSINTFLAEMNNESKGAIFGYAQVTASKSAELWGSLKEILSKLKTDGINEKMWDSIKLQQLNETAFSQTSCGNMDDLLMFKNKKFPTDSIDKLPDILASITLQEMNEFVRKHINIQDMFIVLQKQK